MPEAAQSPPVRAAPATDQVADRADDLAPDVLPRRVGLWTATAVTMGIIIGSGIFGTPSAIAERMGTVGGIAFVWLLGGLVTVCLALCLAELATMFPRSGGIYVFLREAYGPAIAFVFGWTFLLINPAQWAAISRIFGDYLGEFLPLTENGRRAAASLLVLFVSTANYFSVRFAAAIQNFATSGKALALAAIAVVIFLLGDHGSGAFAQPLQFSMPQAGVLAGTLVLVLWSYEGVAASCALSGEVRNPGHTLPRALIMSVLGVMTLYLLINAAYLYALPLDGVAGSTRVATDAMRAVTGPGAAAVISACVLLSTFGAVAATSIVDPRVFYALARDGLFFERIGAVHPRHRTPHVAIVLSGALAIVYIWARTFYELAAQFILGLWLFYALAVLGLVLLRRRRPELERPYRTFGYPVVPLVFVASAGLLLAVSLVEDPEIGLVNLAVTLAGFPVYWLWRRFRNRGRIATASRATP